MNDDNGEPDTFQTPSRAQELALAVLPIPSAILSILGSSIIIYMSVSTRRVRKWTPYTRLLLCLSFYDIIASITLGMASFLRNQDTSTRPFSFGTSGTCTMVGFFNQFSYGTLIYNGSLSLYFLLTCRFGYSNAYIARIIEPWIHIIGNTFAASTSIVALALGAYDEMTGGTGCWVANYPRGCGEGPDCTSRLIGWLYFGLPSISIFILVLIFNSIIFIFVRRHKVPLRLSKPEVEGADKTKTDRDESTGSSSHADDDDDDWNPRRVECVTEVNEKSNERVSQNASQLRDQEQRLRLVSTQAFLYVAFFLMCNVWTGVVGIIESSGSTREAEMQLVVDNYVIFILQAVFTPLQGVFNMAVFIRPKLHLCAAAFPSETRLWIVRRTIFGNRVKPTCSFNGPSRTTDSQRGAPIDQRMNDKRRQEGARNEPAVTRLPRDMISSVTASEGDFDSEMPVSNSTDERWANTTNKEKGFSSILASLPIRFESSLMRNPRSSLLEVISENEASTFEPISRISITEELVLDMSSGEFFPANAESRWASDSSYPASTSSGTSGPMSMPQRERSTVEETDPCSPAEKEPVVTLLVDQPMKVPQRRSLPGSPTSTERKALEPELQNSLRQNTTATHNGQDEDKPIKVPVRRSSLDE